MVSKPSAETKAQDQQWSRHARKYEELFLDPFGPGVENPLLAALDAMPHAERLTVADLGCGTGPLLPRLVDRFGSVIALDFAPAMLDRARERLGRLAEKVVFEQRAMHELDDYKDRIDVAVTVNSMVMPDVRDIDRSLKAIHASLRPGGHLLGIVPSIDAIYYQTMLLMDQALDRGLSPDDAERHAAYFGEHRYYSFPFGRFKFRGLRQKFWQSFEIRYRLTKAGFGSVVLGQVLYPWDDNLAGGRDFAHHPRSWDWFFSAQRPPAENGEADPRS